MQNTVTAETVLGWKFSHQVDADVSPLHLLDAYRGVAFLANKIETLGSWPDNTDPKRMNDMLFMRFMATQMSYNLNLIEKYLGIRIIKKDFVEMHKKAYRKDPVSDPALNHGEACIIARAAQDAMTCIVNHRSELPGPVRDELEHHLSQIEALLVNKDREG